MPTDQDKVIRKLSAILSADVKGYSVLMADDEIHTIETLKSYRQIISDLISEHSGRVVDSPGDNILAEFRSAVDAVKCAAEIQTKLKQENERYGDDKKVQFRIGVNIGDVVQVVQGCHDFFTDHGRRNFLFPCFAKVSFNLVHVLLDQVHADIPFLARFLDSRAHLFTMEDFPAPILLDDHNGNLFDVLVGREPAAAQEALPAPADHAPVLANPGIDNLVVDLPAKWTLHKSSP